MSLTLSSCSDDDSYETSDNAGHGDGTYVTSGQWVDLGLPSGLLWASCNVGAEYPEQYGNYYAWGETTTKIEYNWNTYKYCMNGDYHQLTKYCSNSSYGYNGFTDNFTTMQTEDDAATANLGGGARTPYSFDWQELIDYTTQEDFTLYGIDGKLLTASNGNSIFIPFAGERIDGRLENVGFAYYQSASLNTTEYSTSIMTTYKNYYRLEMSGRDRCTGLPVRAVRQR